MSGHRLRRGLGLLSSAVLERDPQIALTPVGDRWIGRIPAPRLEFRCECGADHVPDSATAGSLHRPVVLAYGAGTRAWGSVRLRVVQSLGLLYFLGVRAPLLGMTAQRLAARPVIDSTIVLGKTALQALGPAAIEQVKAEGSTVLFDAVDGLVQPELAGLADGFVCASRSEFAFRSSSARVPVHLVPHAIDQRIDVPARTHDHFSCAYAGRRVNGQHLGDLRGIDVIATPGSTQGGRDSRRWVDDLSAYSHHYVVRQRQEYDGFKPFTKGFVASALGAAVIASADDEEDRLMLGDDYPYLSRSSRLADVRQCLDFARESFGGADWRRAQERMRTLAEAACPITVGNRLVAALGHHEHGSRRG